MDDFILVTGATGKTGLALVEQLNGADVDVRAATRSPYAAGQVRFEWQDRSTHRSALNGVTGVYLVAPTDANEHLPIMRPFLEDALEAGVQRFVLLSASILDETCPLMGEVHAWLAAHAPHWTVLRPSWFMQNFVTQHLPGILGDDAIYSATQDGRVPFIDAADIAAVAARALTCPDFASGEAPILTGPETLSYDDAAAAISDVAGRAVRHEKLTADEMKGRFESFGIPADFAAVLASLDTMIAQGAEDRVTHEVERLTGAKPRNFEDFLQRNRSIFHVIDLV